MFQFDRGLVWFIDYPDYQLRLSQRHLRVEPSRIHSMRIQIVAISYMFVHPKRPFDNYLSLSVPRPSAISPAPKVVLIINIYYLLLMQGGEE